MSIIFGVNEKNCPYLYIESLVSELGYFLRLKISKIATKKKFYDSSSIIKTYVNYLLNLKKEAEDFLRIYPQWSKLPVFIIVCLKIASDKSHTCLIPVSENLFTEFLTKFCEFLLSIDDPFQKEELLKLLVYSRNLIFGSASGYSILPNNQESIPYILLGFEKLSSEALKHNYIIKLDSSASVFNDLSEQTPLNDRFFSEDNPEFGGNTLLKNYLNNKYCMPLLNPLVEMGLYLRAIEDGVENFETETLAEIYGISS